MTNDISTVFISRDLSPGSAFRQRMNAAGLQVTARSLIHFTALPFDELPAVDWIFFYSKRAVRYFFEMLRAREMELSSTIQLATIGAATAAAVRRFGYSCDFTGTGEPTATSQAFAKLAHGRRVLFPRARHSRRSVQEYLGDSIVPFDLVVYDNHPVDEVPDADFDVLVFTSPLNAQAYFAKRNYVPGQRVVAIGPTTETALRQLGIEALEIAVNPSEEALADTVLTRK